MNSRGRRTQRWAAERQKINAVRKERRHLEVPKSIKALGRKSRGR